MSKRRLLLLFILAGAILGLVFGVRFYQSGLGPSDGEVRDLLADYTAKIAAGDLAGARELMTAETRPLLRDPGTPLGEAVYRNLSLVSVDRVYAESGNGTAADVTLRTADTLKIMAKAGILFGERIAEEGPAEDADRLLNEIYTEILSRDDLPLLDCFCVVRFEKRDGHVLIAGDEALRRAVEGGSEQSLSVLEQFGAGINGSE